jgi:hypothetical protein
LQNEPRPAWFDERRPGIVFLSSRTSAEVAEAWYELTAPDTGDAVIVERLSSDAYEHCLRVLDVLDRIQKERHGKEPA